MAVCSKTMPICRAIAATRCAITSRTTGSHVFPEPVISCELSNVTTDGGRSLDATRAYDPKELPCSILVPRSSYSQTRELDLVRSIAHPLAMNLEPPTRHLAIDHRNRAALSKVETDRSILVASIRSVRFSNQPTRRLHSGSHNFKRSIVSNVSVSTLVLAFKFSSECFKTFPIEDQRLVGTDVTHFDLVSISMSPLVTLAATSDCSHRSANVSKVFCSSLSEIASILR